MIESERVPPDGLHWTGRRLRDRVIVERHVPGQVPEPLDPRHHVSNHSPTGFEWGYVGSGPHQLALALCCDYLADDYAATAVYTDVLHRVVALFHADGWTLAAHDLGDAIAGVMLDRHLDQVANAQPQRSTS